MKKIIIILFTTLITSCTQENTYNKFAHFNKNDSISTNASKPSLFEGYIQNDTIYLKRK